MRRLALAISVLAIAALAPPSTAAASVRSSYCTPSGDYCKFILKRDGKRVFDLRTAALYAPPAAYRLCVRDPAGSETCRKFRLGAARYGYRSVVTWSAHFPTDGGRGTYRVRWDDDGVTYGPALTFRR